MAEKKTEKKTTKSTPKKKNTCVVNGHTYKILEETEHKYKLTDGIIHFWVKKDNAERN